MPQSKAFEGIKRDVLLIVATIPEGRITTFKSIGAYMDVLPRHIAYILATLSEKEQQTVPWYRVVGEKGKLGKTKFDAEGRSQQELLEAEGLSISNGQIVEYHASFIEAGALDHSVIPKKRYSDAE